MRKVFFSFHYANDINRAMVVRNSWVTQERVAAGFIDKAEFECIKKTGTEAVHKWIDKQLENTSVTVVLIGEETLKRPFVKYEICESIKKGNGLIGVFIHKVKDMKTKETSLKGNAHSVIGQYSDGSSAYFDVVCDGLYDYIEDNRYDNLGKWIEKAAKAHNRKF